MSNNKLFVTEKEDNILEINSPDNKNVGSGEVELYISM